MEQETGFNYLLKTKEMQNLYNYLKNTAGWNCMSPEAFQEHCKCNCLIHDIWRRYERIYLSKILANLGKKVFAKEGEHEFSYFCAIFKDAKNMENN